MTNRIPSVNSLLKKIWIAAAILIILAAVSSSIFRSLTPWAKQYKKEVEQHLTHILGQPVTIQTMETGWYWFQPVLKLKNLTINEGQKKSIHLEKLLVGIDLFKSLWHWRIQPGVLYIDTINLTLRQQEGHWSVDGLSIPNLKENDMTSKDTQQILGWLSQQEHLVIRNVSLYFHFSDGGLIPVSGLNVSIVNKGTNYKLKAEARLEQTNSSAFQLLGDVDFDFYHPKDAKGQFYFSAKKVSPAQWQSVWSGSKERVEGGRGDISLWVDLNKGAVSLVQAQVQFKRLAWRIADSKTSQMIQSIAANLSWKPNDKGWQFNADHLKLRTGGVSWPENQVLIKFDKTQSSYLLYAKSIIIESLLAQSINWPVIVQKLVPLKPHGLLSNTQLLIKDKQLSYFLSRFDQLGWNAQNNIPQVSRLSGVLNWQPDEGRLELDSENATVALKNYPKQTLTLLNGALDWKELSDGLRLSIERFVLSQPELTVSLQGAIDQVTRDSIGNIRLVTEFSAKNIQQWMPYLPQKKLKPKLLYWLQNDLKRIAEMSGKITINGLAKDFPFDNHDGEFSIISHASGGDLLINPKWPLIKDIEGYIRLKNRNLDIDIVNADFQGAPVKQMNLRIDDIGKDKETLLIHGLIKAPAQKMMNYVLASPLKEKLSTLKMLSLKGLLGLNLQVEIPLYPENDTNLAKGELSFKENTVLIKHALSQFAVEHVTGDLTFDEHGITHSALVAAAFGYPLNIKIQSVKQPEPYTQLSVDGKFTVESLKSHFNVPIFSVLSGLFFINAEFKLTDNPKDMDSINIKSSLDGLTINLPAPLGKTADTTRPLEVNLGFNSVNGLRLKANYNNKLSADLLFKDTKEGFGFQSGEVKLGDAQAINQNKPGLALVGTLDGFDLQEWKKVLEQFSSDQTNSSISEQLRLVNVKMGKLNVFNQPFDHLHVKGERLANKNWTFNLQQEKIAADLTYHPATNTLSGFAKYLHLAKIENSDDADEDSPRIKPSQIPNLNLRVDNLSIGQLKIGDLTFKSHSKPNHWSLDYCRIDSPVYQYNLAGDWVQKGTTDSTSLHLKLHLNDLAKSLERWNIEPAVDAGKGDIEFRGNWSDTPYRFSLALLNGTMYIELKNGRITNLSPETEGKLGLGKLLSVLSLQTIPRRLKLDFSDLSHQGYSFDIFKGNFKIKKGIMNTQDSYIDGPVAYASMKGDLDLVKRLYDLDLSISPHITASLPIVATIAGGPLAGLAAWVANKIINQSMQKISAYSYKISGPWKEPVVQQLTIIKKAVKKN